MSRRTIAQPSLTDVDATPDELLAALERGEGHPLRARILLALRAGPSSASRLLDQLRDEGCTIDSLPALAYHVRWLRDRKRIRVVKRRQVLGAVETTYALRAGVLPAPNPGGGHRNMNATGHGPRTINTGDAHSALVDALADLLHVTGGDDHAVEAYVPRAMESARRHFDAERADGTEIHIENETGERVR